MSDILIEYFRSRGVEPIIIDPTDEESINQGLNAVTERITENTKDPETDDKQAPNTNNTYGNNHQ